MRDRRVLGRAEAAHRSHAAVHAGSPARRVRTADAGAFIALLAILATVSTLPTAAGLVPAPAATRLVRVESNDTLWGIARTHATGGASTAQTVDVMQRLNHLSAGEALQPGTVVAVPCVQASDSAFARR